MLWRGQLNVKNGTAKNKVTKEEAMMICKYCILCINVLLICSYFTMKMLL